jgi:hypothetical protein
MSDWGWVRVGYNSDFVRRSNNVYAITMAVRVMAPVE